MGDKIIISKVKLVNIGDAVREKEGSSEQILIDDIPKRIRAIQTGVDTESIYISLLTTTYGSVV